MPSIRAHRSTLTVAAFPLAALLVAAGASGCAVLSSDSTDAAPAGGLVVDANDLAGPPSTTATTEADVKVFGAVEIREESAPSRYEIVGVPRGLNLRAGPGTEYAVIVGVEKDRILTATGDAEAGWMEVTVDGLVGWVADGYLRPTDREPAPVATTESTTPASTTTTATVPTSTVLASTELVVVGVPVGLNLRGGPGLEFAVVGGAELGETVQATGQQADGWIQVTYAGVTGWARAEYLAAG